MRILMLLFCLGVCYVSLPVTSPAGDDAPSVPPATLVATSIEATIDHGLTATADMTPAEMTPVDTAPADAEISFSAAEPADDDSPQLILFDANAHLAQLAATVDDNTTAVDPAADDTAADEAVDDDAIDDDAADDDAKDADSDTADNGADENESADAAAAESADEKPAATEEKSTDDASAEKPDDEKKADESQAAAEKKAAAETKTDEKADAQAEKKKADKPKKKERKTHTVKPKRLQVEVSLDGAFVADSMTEVPLRPEVWSQYEIVEVVPHGTTVHAGETLIKFDDEKLNETIADLELDQRISELSILKAERELPRQEKSLEMDAVEAERTDKNAKQDYKRYHEIDRPMILKSVKYSLKYAQFNVDYQQDELDQLEKMYEADDLTEDTEEVVLRRTRNQLEFAEFNLESAKLNMDEILDVRLPRNDVRIKESLDRAELNLTRAKTSLAVDLSKARYELEKAKQSRAQSLDRHLKLLADRDLMEIKAPADGVVYYGACEDGRWSDMATMLKKLEPHNNVSPGTVMMTILDPRPMHVLAIADEDKRPSLAAGQSTKLTPPGDDAKPLDVKLKSVSTAPIASGKFSVEFDLAGSELPEWIVPGVSCKLKIKTYDKADALTVPKKAVHTDEEDEDEKYVWLVDPDDDEAKPERRNVETGKTSGDDLEIIKGLKEGDVISLEDESKKDEQDS